MSQVKFYVLSDSTDEQTVSTSVEAHIDFACQLTAQLYRQKKRIFIYTDSEKDAHLIDEHLWQFEPESFVAHNLQGEGPKFGSPVEIGHQPPTASRPVLINLSADVPDFVQRFGQVFDFVPAQDTLKQQARERYKHYRAAGHVLSTEPVA